MEQKVSQATWDSGSRYGKRTSQLFGNDLLGYTPGSFSISHTLEYAYADWCLGKLAKWAGDSSAEEYLTKGQAWRNVFNDEKRWFRPRNAEGGWEPWPENARTKVVVRTVGLPLPFAALTFFLYLAASRYFLLLFVDAGEDVEVGNRFGRTAYGLESLP